MAIVVLHSQQKQRKKTFYAAVLVGKIEIAKLREFQAKTYELQKDDSTYKPTPPNFNSRIAYQKSTGQLSADIIKELFT